jgi:predicted transcriptional regulator
MAVTTQLSVRVEESEKKFLEELCERANISQAQAIRDYIKASYEAGELIVSPNLIQDLPPEIRERLSRLEERLEKLESAIAKTGQPAIMIQKQPLPLAVEIQRTHEEAAQDWGKTLATVKRWAKDPDKWPEGWLYDGDKNFWVKEV